MIFEEWLSQLDLKFKRQGQKIIMIVDNCPTHPEFKGLKSIYLQFLPPHTTSCSQPMDQGVIKYVVYVYNIYF